MRDAYARSASGGWEAFLTAFADGAVAWRFELCEELVQSPVATPGNENDRALLAAWTRHAITNAGLRGIQCTSCSPMQDPYFRARHIAQLRVRPGADRAVPASFRRDSARLLIERALELAPNEPAVICAQGEYLLHGDDVPGARARFERAQAIDPLYASAPLLLGDCCVRENNLASAAALSSPDR